MLQKVEPGYTSQEVTGYDVEISSIATAVPHYKFSQKEALERTRFFIPKYACLSDVFNSTGIKTRYSCVPME